MWLDPPGKPSPLIRDTFLNATEKLLDLCFKKGKKDADFEFIEGKKSNGDRIEADNTNDEENIEDEEKSDEDEFVDYSNDGDWTPLSPHGRLVVRKI